MNVLLSHVRIGAIVTSEKNKGMAYVVTCEQGKWFCWCPDYGYRNRHCKHIRAVQAEVNNNGRPKV